MSTLINDRVFTSEIGPRYDPRLINNDLSSLIIFTPLFIISLRLSGPLQILSLLSTQKFILQIETKILNLFKLKY